MSQPATEPGTDGDEALYGAYYYVHNCGIPYGDNDHWRGFFAAVADKLIARYQPTKVLDAGCAWGFLVRALRERGVEAYGVDISPYAIAQVPEEVKPYCWEGSLLDPLPDRYDLVVCVEVIEHLTPADGAAALANLCAATDRLVLTSTPDDYAEATHLNVQQPDYWAGALADLGFLHDLEGDELSPLPPWAAVYERSTVTAPALARRYERRLWEYRREVHAVRDQIIALENELEELTSGRPLALEADVVRLEEALLNARDAAIGHEVALGEALGTIRAMEQQVSRYRDAAERLDAVLGSTTWRITQKALSPYRRLRGIQ